MTTRPFSGRQLALLEMLDHVGIDGHISVDEAMTLNQTTFRSAMIRGYCVYRASGANRGFHVTKDGREALRLFRNADITRKDPTQPLTAYFDAASFGITPERKKKEPAKARGPAPGKDNVREFIKKQKAS